MPFRSSAPTTRSRPHSGTASSTPTSSPTTCSRNRDGRWLLIVEISRTSSRRADQRLHMLDDCLAVHQTKDVADLRHDIQTACAAS